ncbi:carbohydrate-binding protein [Salibacterium aidingense]|uniref:carbohydrate-binding protein n=1 Tax=Salibacterium aidingense TaxID=384933 RepID=UPI003BD49E3E
MKKRLTLAALSLIMAAGAIGTNDTVKAEEGEVLKVDLSSSTGEIRHGASGFLYGLGDKDNPSKNLIAPLSPQVIAQKAPDGLQHPNGDALDVAESYADAGGKQIQIYIQDRLEEWPYEDIGLEEYKDIVDEVVTKVKQHPQQDKFAYVPFNEPDYIWYSMEGEKKTEFFEDWKEIYHFIRERDPDTPIVGPNTANYNEEFFEDFYEFAAKHDVLPDITSWHELSNDFYEGWYDRYNSYRAIENQLEIEEREISINEYAQFMDLSTPGQLVQWMTRFENSKVDASLAYWHIAGNLNDLAAETNVPNGAWWLYKWYGQMTGETVKVTPPERNEAGLQGIASLDSEKRQARVILGGTNGQADVEIEGLNELTNNNQQVNVKVEATDWSGHKGEQGKPDLQYQKTRKVDNGKITVPVENMDPIAAYQIQVSPKTKDKDSNDQYWKGTFEAEDAELINARTLPSGSLENPGENASSGEEHVGYIDYDDSRVNFQVNVPEAGRYTMNIFYGNGTRSMAQQIMKVNDQDWEFVDYQPTPDWTFFGTNQVKVELEKGENDITFGRNAESIGGTEGGGVTLDKIDLQPVTEDAAVLYEAEDQTLFGAAEIDYWPKKNKGNAVVSFSQEEASLEFVIYVDENAVHELNFQYLLEEAAKKREDYKLNLYVNNDRLKNMSFSENRAGALHTKELFLEKGINRVKLQKDAGEEVPVSIDHVVVENSSLNNQQSYEAEENRTAGDVMIEKDPYASNGRYVEDIGNGAENTLIFEDIEVSVAGDYKMIVRYANDERWEGHDYNLDVVDRYADITVNEEESQRCYFRTTYGWNSYREKVVDVSLNQGNNTIEFSNEEAYAPNIDQIKIVRIQ